MRSAMYLVESSLHYRRVKNVARYVGKNAGRLSESRAIMDATQRDRALHEPGRVAYLTGAYILHILHTSRLAGTQHSESRNSLSDTPPFARSTALW